MAKKKNTAIPGNAKRVALRPLALGERTGHHHSLYADGGTAVADLADAAPVQMFEVNGVDGLAATMIRVTEDGISLQHQEHKPALVAPGEYEVVLQRENTDWGAAPVRD